MKQLEKEILIFLCISPAPVKGSLRQNEIFTKHKIFMFSPFGESYPSRLEA
jgi:hypothetical protein